MKKVAFDVSFNIRTRVVIEVDNPENLTAREENKLIYEAGVNVRGSIGDYIHADNLEDIDISSQEYSEERDEKS